MVIEYDPVGVCSKHFTIEVEDGVIRRINFVGGCHGNLQGIEALLRGMAVSEAVSRPDQLAQALKQAV